MIESNYVRTVCGISAAREPYKKQCVICGSEYAPLRANSKTCCKPCSIENKRRLKADNNNRNRAIYKATYAEKHADRIAKDRAEKQSAMLNRAIDVEKRSNERALISAMRFVKRRILERDNAFECPCCHKAVSTSHRAYSGYCFPCNRAKVKANRILYREAEMRARYRQRERIKSTPWLRMIHNHRGVIRFHLRKRGNVKCVGKVSMLGISRSEYIRYIESMLKPGMTWDNYGAKGKQPSWEIDHIIPVSHFDLTVESQRLKAFHYTNTQPLWTIENRLKGARWCG